MTTSIIEDLADLVEPEVAAGASPSLSVAFNEGADAAAAAWGDASDGRPATTGTLYQAASISKPITALATLRLAAAGELDLDADVNDLLHTWQLPPPHGWAPHVTGRHLLCHAGALTVHGFPGYRRGEPLPTVSEILDGSAPANTAPVRVEGIPGLHAKYSGGGYTMLGQVLADVTGRSVPELVHELVLQPLGMVDATFARVLPDGLTCRAAHGREGGEPLPGGWHEYPELGAAGLWCTPTDLVRFAEGVQASAAGRAGALLPADVARDMLTEQVPGWGLGLNLDGEAGTRRFSHGGRNAGFLALLVASCEPGPAVAVMANADTAGALMRSAVARVAAHLAWDGYERSEQPDLLAAAKRLAGTYATDAGVRIELVPGPDSLTLVVPGQPGLPLEPVDPAIWLASGVRVEVRVELDCGGTPEAIVVHQLGHVLRATRETTPVTPGSSPAGTR